MKHMIIIFCLAYTNLVLSDLSANNSGKKLKYSYPQGRLSQIAEQEQRQAFKSLERINLLRKVKLHMINGRLEQAKILLKEATITDDFSKETQIRYLATINFIQNNHHEVVKLLNRKEMQDFSTLSKHCLINVISLITLKAKDLIKKRWKDCKAVTIGKSKNNLAWMQVLVNLSTSDPKQTIDEIFKQIKIENLSADNLRIMLKLGLYLNQQDKLIPRFELLTQEILSDTYYRELIGMNYFRNIDLVKAYQLLDNINSPNVEVFKGNLLLSQGNLTKAFAQYNLALKLKENSDNALERLIPLAWNLKQWDAGIEYVSKFSFRKSELVKKYTLVAVFAAMANKVELSDYMIKKIQSTSINREPVELQQVITFNALKTKKDYTIDQSALSNCLKKDAIHCWLLYYKNTWKAPIEMINTNVKIHSSNISFLEKYTKEIVHNPLKQEEFINQKDIEELDNKLIKLIQN